MSEAKPDPVTQPIPQEVSAAASALPGEVAPPVPEAPALASDPAPALDAERPPHPLWAEVEGLLDEVVRKALRRYFHEFTTQDVARFKQRLRLMLLEDLTWLDGVRDPAKLKAWLQRVTDNYVIRVSKEESGKESLDELGVVVVAGGGVTG
jgi:hypothetical protein